MAFPSVPRFERSFCHSRAKRVDPRPCTSLRLAGQGRRKGPMRKNAALAKWRAGQQTIGGWLSLANPHSAEMMANAGFDWLCIDMQHGLIDYGDLRFMLPAIP